MFTLHGNRLPHEVNILNVGSRPNDNGISIHSGIDRPLDRRMIIRHVDISGVSFETRPANAAERGSRGPGISGTG